MNFTRLIMAIIIVTSALITACTSYGIDPLPTSESKFVPPDNKILVFIGQSPEDIGGHIYPLESYSSSQIDLNDPYGYGYVEKMVEEYNAPMPGGITTYFFFQLQDGAPTLSLGSDNDYLDLVSSTTIFDHTTFHISLGIQNVNKEIVDGLFDDQIMELGAKIASYQRPVYLRIGYEFDNIGHGNPNPEIFKEAWKRIVNILDNMEVTSYATVFSSIFLFESIPFLTNCADDNPLNCFSHEAYYPGDDYVDWMGASFWFGPGALFNSNQLAMLKFAKQRNKPVFLSETAPMLTDLKNQWAEPIFLARFELFFDFLEQNRNQIKAIHYINDHWQIDPFWSSVPIYQIFANMDTRLHVNSKVRSLWLEKMSQTDIYLNAYDGLFEELGYEN